MAGTRSRIKALKRKAHQYLSTAQDDKAWVFIAEAMSIDMDDPQVLFMAGVFFRHKGHSGMAAQCFRRCVALDPKAANPWAHFGACLHDIHAYDEALKVFEVCRKMAPQDASVFANMAASYQQKGQFADALNYANEALKRDKERTQAKSVKALALLGLGRWEEGFKLYGSMYGTQVKIRVYCDPEEPEWDGNPGQTVVVQGDQGMGDEIMYASVIPDMAKDVRVVFDCHPKLVNVFKRSFPGVDVYGTRKEQENVKWLEQYKIDSHIHTSGLGKFYRARDKDFPRKPYLLVDPGLAQKWTEVLGAYPKPWVGLTWQGGSVVTMREERSLAIEDWKPLMEKGGTFVDLSYHDSESEVMQFNADSEIKIARFEIDEEDYADTLALLSVLDLVVSVTTTVVHACGAIGKDCFVFVPPMPQWRYGMKRTDIQWYPKSVRLFRGDDAIEQITKAYEGFLAERFPGIRSERSNHLPRMRSEHHREQHASG